MARNPNDIAAYRKEKRRKANITKLVLTILMALGVLIIWTFRATIFEPLRGIAARIDSPGTSGGFPIVLSGSASYDMNRVDTNFLLLSDTYLYTYTNTGSPVISYRHNYARPFQRATDRRILVFNFNGQEFSLFSRTGRVYEIKLDDRIVLAELGNNDMAAVVTTSAAFSNVLYIYDRNGRWQYTRRFIDEEVNAVTFTSGNNEIIVATSMVRGGEIISKIYKLRTDTDDDLIWKSELPAGALALGVYENGDCISVLTDSMVTALDSDNGSVVGGYEFSSGKLVKYVNGDDFSLVFLSDYISDSTLFVTLDTKSGLIKEEIMPFEVKKVEIYEEIVYTLTGDLILKHNMFLEQTDMTELEDEYRDFIILGKYALLLGYESVERIATD
ncbi:MAG: DUF5711 family protein [Oscillospiraceae bacterium]|nr:DUF5711 family protein [Oscillospiraceae bacterium]